MGRLAIPIGVLAAFTYGYDVVNRKVTLVDRIAANAT